jgi:hypothetical protein
MRALPCCSHASTEHGPRAIPRRGSDVPPRLAGGVRCGARSERAAAVPLVAALNAPRLHGSSPVRRLRRRTAPLSIALLAGPYSPQRGTSLGPARRSECLSRDTSVVLAKPWPGVRRQRHMRRRAAQGSWPSARSARFVHLTRRDCLSATTAGSEASFSAGDETEQRRVPLAQRGAAASERRRIPGRGFASLDPVSKVGLHGQFAASHH